MKVIACYSMKGGVGKTSTSANIAWFAARSGLKTLLMDLDPQGASSFYFQVKSKKEGKGKRFFEVFDSWTSQIQFSGFDGLDVLPAHLSFRHFDIALSGLDKSKKRLKRMLNKLSKDYDLVILDCPPSISLLSENIFHAADVVLVPVIPTTLSERTLKQLYRFFESKGLPDDKIVPFFSMVQQQKKMHVSTIKRLTGTYRTFLNARIPFSADVEKMGLHRAPVGEFAKSRPVFLAYRNLWVEMVKKLGYKYRM